MGVDVGELLQIAQGVGPVAVLAFLVWKAQRTESAIGGTRVDATNEWRGIAEYYEAQWRACQAELDACRDHPVHGHDT